MQLIDRFAERSLIEGVVRDVRSGHSRVLVLHGDPGIGKSALIEHAARHTHGCRVLRAAGVESEMELAYAALHQLCMPMLDRLDHLPVPQRDALRTAFGLSAGPAPDRFLIGLAVLSLFSEVAEDQPLLGLIDDLQWLDEASAQALAFVARRLGAEPIGMIVATRVLNPAMAALPTMQVRGLREPDARALLDAVLTAPLDERIRNQIVAETGGNPLALLELPRGMGVHELAGGFGLPGAVQLSAAMEESFRRGVQELPAETRRLLLVAAAEPLGDPGLLWRAATALGIGVGAAAPAAAAGLAEFGVRVRFRHPLVRSAVYRSAPRRDKQRVHQALAEVTDPDRDPDRRAWHRAQTTEGTDEVIAAELERSAERAQARGGMAAAAAFLERATRLTLEPARRAERALAAASANMQAGAFDAALNLLAVAESTALTDLQSARVDLIKARLAYVTDRGSDAPALMLKAAERLEPIDAALSRATYLDALQAAWFAGRLASGGAALEVARAALASPKSQSCSPSDLLLDGLVAHFTDGYAAGVPLLRRAVDAARDASAAGEKQHWMFAVATAHLWDFESYEVLSARNLEMVRAAGALDELPLAISNCATVHVWAGELAAAEALIHEVQTLVQATGASFAADPAMTLAAYRGDHNKTSALIEARTSDAMRRGEGVWLTIAEWFSAVLNNGSGDHAAALTAAQSAAEAADLVDSAAAVVELVEAAVRTGKRKTAVEALDRLTEMTGASGTDWALGLEMRSRALLAEGTEAERCYREAIELFSRTRLRPDLARAHLLYGEWLRRERRRIDARMQLRIAYEMFGAMGMHGFAGRARRELAATGETARKCTVAAPTGPHLTPQETQIARMASDGLTNPEIGARLFISAKTVQYHLSKVFTKLAINSRNQLPQALPDNITR